MPKTYCLPGIFIQVIIMNVEYFFVFHHVNGFDVGHKCLK